MPSVKFDELSGQKLIKTVVAESMDLITFTAEEGEYLMNHYQDCCESVLIEDIDGDLEDLQDTTIIKATETGAEATHCHDSGTWTFYRIQTEKGVVVIRWLGESNGYYSERVDFFKESRYK